VAAATLPGRGDVDGARLVTLGDGLHAWWLAGQTRVVGLRRVSRTVSISCTTAAGSAAESERLDISPAALVAGCRMSGSGLAGTAVTGPAVSAQLLVFRDCSFWICPKRRALLAPGNLPRHGPPKLVTVRAVPRPPRLGIRRLPQAGPRPVPSRSAMHGGGVTGPGAQRGAPDPGRPPRRPLDDLCQGVSCGH
jgi:hypothetical protein